MKISTEQLAKVQALDGKVTPPESVVDTAVIRLTDSDLIKQVTAQINELPDRDDMVSDLKARIEAGSYAVTADEIVDAMVRRARADRIS